MKILRNKKAVAIFIILSFIFVFLLTWDAIRLSLLSKKDLQRETAAKIVKELKHMKEQDRDQSELDRKWQEYRKQGILTYEVKKAVYDLLSEEKQRDFLSK